MQFPVKRHLAHAQAEVYLAVPIIEQMTNTQRDVNEVKDDYEEGGRISR